MFANSEVVNQPIFYIFIAISVMLSLGYSWGRRRNTQILRTVMGEVAEVLRPRDQQYTNIGGQTGFHANFLPGALKSVRRVDTTITLLPRQSWLYLPFSLLTRRFDRLYISYELNKHARGKIEEGHLIDTRFERIRGNHIENAPALSCETVEWGTRTFHLYAASEFLRERLRALKEQMGAEPMGFRHLALVPEQDRYYTFIIPQIGKTGPLVRVATSWFEDYIERLGAPSSKKV